MPSQHLPNTSVLLTVFPVGGEVGEFHACAGVDVVAAGFAPSREGVRVYVRLDGEKAIPFVALLGLLRKFQPLWSAPF